jgi:hypothetical protein
MDTNVDILDLAVDDEIERVARSLSGEYRGILNVSLEEETLYDGLDSRLPPTRRAR